METAASSKKHAVKVHSTNSDCHRHRGAYVKNIKYLVLSDIDWIKLHLELKSLLNNGQTQRIRLIMNLVASNAPGFVQECKDIHSEVQCKNDKDGKEKDMETTTKHTGKHVMEKALTFKR